ncbi:MAG: riboflavin biosynthesis protein RibF [Clostridia bacterium]|nr:riboflavin biosynthesis protein RibF [Clostridia bacterium]
MIILNYGEKAPENLILALGYFDAVHKGHVAVLEKAVCVAKEKGLLSGALIFTGGKAKKDVFTLEERIRKISSLKVDVIIIKALDRAFMSKTKGEFLAELSSYYNVQAVVSGEDFTFGKGALGNVQTLIDFFGKDKVFTEKLLGNGEEKYSSSNIKEALTNGDIALANAYLGSDYFISGEVLKGKGLGRTLGFPTANQKIDSSKHPIKSGVYSTYVFIDGKRYNSITNCGAQPTVNGEEYTVETYIAKFNGDLYNKVLTVYFKDRIRDIEKFSSVEELTAQLEKDKRYTL